MGYVTGLRIFGPAFIGFWFSVVGEGIISSSPSSSLSRSQFIGFTKQRPEDKQLLSVILYSLHSSELGSGF